MRSLILANETPRPTAGRWVTTGGVARALQMTTEGVRWLVRDAQLACTRTPSKLRLFHEREVLRLVEQRAAARLAGRLPRRQKLGPRGEPRQMSLLRADLRLIRRASETRPSVDKGQVAYEKTLNKRVAS